MAQKIATNHVVWCKVSEKRVGEGMDITLDGNDPLPALCYVKLLQSSTLQYDPICFALIFNWTNQHAFLISGHDNADWRTRE